MGKNTEKCPPEKNTVVKNTENWWVRSSGDICKFFGISAQTLSNWVKKGCPQESYGIYDLQRIIQWKYEEDESSAFVRKLKADADWKEAKAGQESIKLAVTEGRFVATEDVTKDLRRLFMVLRRNLLAIGHNVATELNTFDPEAALTAKKVIDDAIQNSLAQLADAGAADKKQKMA